jgi:threonine dehydrogenase-like Zn-dependent dehydrogenase
MDLSAIVVDEISLVGSRCGPFAPALRLLEKKLIDPTLLIDKYFFLAEALQAFEFVARRGVFKVLLVPHLSQ